MTEHLVGGWRRFAVDSAGVRAVTPVPDEGFRLVVDGRFVAASDLRLTRVSPSNGGGLGWRLEGQGLAVDVHAEGTDGVVRTQLAVAGQGRLERVEVERWDAESGGAGLGQPLFGHRFFAGLEHPGAEGFALPVDVDLASHGTYTVPPLVVGRAAPGEELSAFWDELDRVRACPACLVVLANNWYQLGAVGRMDERSVVAELAGFGDVADRLALALDWYCLDDPWDGEWERETGLWGRLAPARFPSGLAGLQDAARGRVGGIGLWVSPWGGYFDRHDARVAWGREHGFEVEDGPWPRLCPAGEAYSAHLADSMHRFTAAGVGYWKIDGVQFDCQDAGHGHAVGPAGRTQQMDRLAALLDGVRAVRPDAVLTFTTGSNPSPWWLRHADFVWRGGLDDDAPEEFDGGRHERFATYIDSCLDAFRPTGVPVSAVVTFSVVENGVRAYRDEGEEPRAWVRHCWLLVGRGTHHHDLYVAPDSLTDGEWQALARALGWARANQAVLARSRMVGGRPHAGEAYGFVSVAGDRIVACLRNPSGQGRRLAVDLGGEALAWEPVWGRNIAEGDRLDVELEPFEVILAAGRWRPGTRRDPPG